MPYLPPAPGSAAAKKLAKSLPLVAGDAYSPVDLVSPEGERKSNCVAGFQYNRLLQIGYAVGSMAMLLVVPLWPVLVAREAKDWSLATTGYLKTLRYCLKSIADHVKHGSFLRMIKYNILHGPDYVKNRIAQRRGACTRCAKCCRAFDCIFLGQDKDSGDYYCKVFGTSYWYYGTCGRYPIDQRDIDDHACPGFSFPVTDEEMREAKKSLPPKKLPVVGQQRAA